MIKPICKTCGARHWLTEPHDAAGLLKGGKVEVQRAKGTLHLPKTDAERKQRLAKVRAETKTVARIANK